MKTLAVILATLFLHVTSVAQLCSGSLGDPAAIVTFSNGSNPGPPWPSVSNTYKYVTNSCPGDGEYAITNLTFACFNQTWHTLSNDHTPDDASGYYMLVNASFQPGDFLVETVSGLCGGTNYEFSAWVVNMLKPGACNNSGIDPNLTFKIETTAGVTLATYNTGDILETQSPVWTKYGIFVQLPAGVSDVVVRITNNSSGGCGNDIALDDIAFRPCGPSVNAMFAANNSNELNVCEGDNTSFVLAGSYSAGYTNPSFQWQVNSNGTWADIPGATSINYLRPPTGSGAYIYRITIGEGANIFSPNCRVNSNEIFVSVSALPHVQLTNYVFGCYGDPVSFIAAGGQVYQWSGPNSFASNLQAPVIPKVQFTDAGLYKVRVTTHEGCADTGSITLAVYPAATASVSNDVSICEGDSTTLHATGGLRYTWLPKKNISNDTTADAVARPVDTTTYSAIVINQYGCTDTAKVKVNVWKKPLVDAGPDKKTRLGLPMYLNGSVQGSDINYYWTPATYIDNPGSLKPQVNPPQTMTYTLNAESLRGCGVVSDNVSIKVYERVLIPNAFSPNGDGINDTWVIDPLELFEESVTEVYDRYGKIVYRSKGYSKPWDGTRNGHPVPVGTYYYIINMNINREPPLSGSLFIVR